MAVAIRPPRALRPFQHHGYRLLVTSAAASLAATGVWLVAVAWQVIAVGGGPRELSLVAMAYSAGLLTAILFGGLAADRLSKKVVLITVEAVRIVAATTAGVLALTGTLRIWQLAVAALLIGAAEAFFYPAYSALLPVLLPADELLAANGIEATLRPAAERAVGPAIAGALVTAFSPGVALLATAAGYLLALVPLVILRVPTVAGHTTDSGRGSLLRGLAEGFGFLFRTRWLAATLVFSSLWSLAVLGPLEVLLPFAVRDRLGGGPDAFAMVLAAYGLASAMGSLAVASWRLPRRYLTTMMLLWGLGITPLAVFGLAEHVVVMLIAAAVIGFTDAIAMVIWGTLLQRRVPPQLLGRVSSLDFFVSLTLMPVSMALAGPAGEALGLTASFIVAAAVPAVTAPLAILLWRLHHDEIAHPLDHTENADTAAPAVPSGG